MKKIIDISGYGHSGKTVVTDYLKQYDQVFGFPNYVEFELFRVPGGLLDLYFALYESWNLIRSRVRINEFKSLAHRIGMVQTIKNPLSYFKASGHGYEQHFNNQFIAISERLIAKIIMQTQYNTFWPYENLRVTPIEVFFNKFKAKFFNQLVSVDLYYSDRNTFIKHVQTYINELFNEVGTTQHTHIVLNNAYDPFNPSICLDMIEDGVGIVVERDPRDIYASQIDTNNMFIPDFEMTKTADKIRKQFTGFNDIDYFIFRYKTIRQNVIKSDDTRVMRLKYEDFVLNHEDYSNKVLDFVGINRSASYSADNFDINNSIKNIGIWKKYSHLPEIIKIEKELAEYCYQQ